MIGCNASALDEPALLDCARTMAQDVHQSAILCLEGALGAGKSTFARGWIHAMTGEVDIPSPTFSLVQEYCCLNNNLTLYHMDLYRLSHKENLEELGFEEMLNNGICLIEWASKIPEAIENAPTPLAILRLDFCGADKRNLRLESSHEFWFDLAQKAGMEKSA